MANQIKSRTQSKGVLIVVTLILCTIKLNLVTAMQLVSSSIHETNVEPTTTAPSMQHAIPDPNGNDIIGYIMVPYPGHNYNQHGSFSDLATSGSQSFFSYLNPMNVAKGYRKLLRGNNQNQGTGFGFSAYPHLMGGYHGLGGFNVLNGLNGHQSQNGLTNPLLNGLNIQQLVHLLATYPGLVGPPGGLFGQQHYYNSNAWPGINERMMRNFLG